jgi:beta-1,4-mannosyltransferase
MIDLNSSGRRDEPAFLPGVPYLGGVETASVPRQAGVMSSLRPALRVLAWPIDLSNPYTAALYKDMGEDVQIERFSVPKLARRHDVWHVHWPESLLNIRNSALSALKLRAFLSMVDLVRRRGGKLIWTIHNSESHEGAHPALEAAFWRSFIPRVDGVIGLSDRGLALAAERLPPLRRLPSAVIPHGHYRELYSPCSVDARRALGISEEARVVLFFGEIRAYKNVNALISAFHRVRDPDAVLLIAGRPNSETLAENIRKAAAVDARVLARLTFIPDDRVSMYLEAADLVALPYRSILNSGSAILALSLNRPVLVPDLGAMQSLKEDFGSQWVRTFTPELDVADLSDAISWSMRPRGSACEIPEKYEWRNIRSETVRFYRRVAGVM